MNKYFRLSILLIIILPLIMGCSRKPLNKDNSPGDASTEINAFAIDVFKNLPKSKSNTFFSPYSIVNALGMTFAGAKENTFTEMAKVLHIEEKPKYFHADLSFMNESIGNKARNGITLNIANSLWVQEDYNFLDSYLDFVRGNYASGVYDVDFRNPVNREKARQRINDWVEKETAGKITDLIPEGILDELSRMVLTNAIYFYGNWKTEFSEENSKEMPFQLSSKKRIKTMFMSGRKKYNYYQSNDLQALEIPYTGDNFSMLILLPVQTEGIVELYETLTVDMINKITSGLHEQEVVLTMPRFKITGEYNLNNVLKELGMKDAFSKAADFSGMTGKKDLFIDAVLHKSYVNVDEKGTEAAAATAVIMAEKTSIGADKTIYFNANHPFIFLIRDRESNLIMFMGSLIDPTK